jgi:hypothetical protein
VLVILSSSLTPIPPLDLTEEIYSSFDQRGDVYNGKCSRSGFSDLVNELTTNHWKCGDSVVHRKTIADP